MTESAEPHNPRQLVDHTYPCGHTVRITRRNAAKNSSRCWPCELPFHEERKRAERLEKKRDAARRKRQPATPAQRAAQRHLVATVTTARWIIDAEQASLMRDEWAGSFSGSAEIDEVRRWFAVLGIPCTLTQVEPLIKGSRGPAYLIGIAWHNLAELQKWAPTIAKKLHNSLSQHDVAILDDGTTRLIPKAT